MLRLYFIYEAACPNLLCSISSTNLNMSQELNWSRGPWCPQWDWWPLTMAPEPQGGHWPPSRASSPSGLWPPTVWPTACCTPGQSGCSRPSWSWGPRLRRERSGDMTLAHYSGEESDNQNLRTNYKDQNTLSYLHFGNLLLFNKSMSL